MNDLSIGEEQAALVVAVRDSQIAGQLAEARARGKALAVSPARSEVTGNLIDGFCETFRWDTMEVGPGDGVPVGWEVYQ